ncbi:hypothetical protein [Wenyingzhuangia sp. 2_MG-2023]|uniref:hypothetical protein n=1 Tax=Wenyingzhuangia sp. 2_MG-2023 TaxID=3062639 RepID=UPI0026E2EB86|nr:hypothetical protein [Wenyingzhuangia sp. 2_MG-2023]MDO6736313.1 hypothetical protein [Wenyingzhuangia sp. 2_MG-2023]MDO6801382.1 hypothetical protein [Wenyingzhuangia sp. 1_MG-2023]
MKKILLTVVLGLLISVSTMAQSKNEKRAIKITNNKIELIEKSIELSESEKETFIEFNKAYISKHLDLRALKKSDPAKYKTEVKANKNNLIKKLNDAFGKERATEIMNAGKKKKNK